MSDILGNRGEVSDEVTVETKTDTTFLVIESLQSKRSKINKNSKITVNVYDDYEVAEILLEYQKGKEWILIEKKNLSDNKETDPTSAKAEFIWDNSALPNGDYTVRATTVDVNGKCGKDDTLGNRGEASEEVTIQTLKDTTPPVITQFLPVAKNFKDAINLSVTVKDNIGAVKAVFEYSLDNTEWKEIKTIEKTAAANNTFSHTWDITYTYNADNSLASVKDAENGSSSCTYDKNKNITKVTDPMGGETIYNYDTLNRITKEVNAIGSTHEYTYNAVGLLETYKNSKNQETSYTYDKAGRLTKTVDEAGKISYTYDKKWKCTENKR